MTSVTSQQVALHPMPRLGVVFREQLASTGLAMWREGALLLAFLIAAAWPTISECVRLAESFRATGLLADSAQQSWFRAQLGIDVYGAGPVAALALAAVFLPAVVWRGGEANRREYLAAMPLPAAGHALLKVAAGWTWAMAGVAVFSLGMIVVAVVAERILGGAPIAVHLRGGAGAPWQWVVPFTGVTVAYLAGSAVALAARHPWRLILLGFGGWVVASVTLAETVSERATDPIETLFEGRLGLGAAITGINIIRRSFRLGSDYSVSTSVDVPDFDRWLPALLLWSSIALGAVILAAYRRAD